MEEIQQTLQKVIEKIFGIKFEPVVTSAPENTGADYATNVAMQLAKLVHKAPMVIAEAIAAEWADLLSERSALSNPPVRSHRTLSTAPLRASDSPRISSPLTSSDEVEGGLSKVTSSDEVEKAGSIKVEVAAPGFLNFKLNNEAVVEQVKGYANDLAREVADDSYQDKMVVAEFSDPNPFKVLHVGHLYTSIVGDSISRLLEFAGAKVVRANFGGDVGLHVAKTLYALMNSKQSGELSDILDTLTIEDIAKCYVEGTRAYDEDEAAKAEITRLNKEIYRINSEDLHDTELAQLYWRGRELSYQYFDEFYTQIGVKFDKYYPESSVADRGLLEVRAHTGTTYEESDGAVVYRGEKVGLHTRVFINREGVPTYEAKDVGLIFTKWDDWHFDESVVVTGNEQSDYMKVVLASVSEYAPQLVDRTRHLTHGLVKLPGNVKMSSRKGNFLKAVEVLDMIRELLKRDDEKVDERVLLAAVKYAFLKYKMGGDIVFDPQESVSVTGNSGIYLLYSAVRAKKILQKSSEKQFESVAEEIEIEKTFEKKLCKKIVQYKDILTEAVKEKAPYKVCNYLYELSQEFSRFYEHVKVAGNQRESELRQVVQAYYNVMEHGLSILGIEIPDSM